MWFLYFFGLFFQNDFSADVFLQDLWNKVPLEVLRDDLGSYLKVLVSNVGNVNSISRTAKIIVIFKP